MLANLDQFSLAAFAAPVLLSAAASAQSYCTESAMLTASDAAPGDYFGTVAVHGDTIVVGAFGDNHGGGGPAGAGSAYVYVRSGTGWIEQAILKASNAANGDALGQRVAVVADTAIAGAHQDDHSSFINAGSAYVFVRTGTTWTEQAILTANNAASGDAFGIHVDISHDTAVVGSYLDDNGNGIDAGAAYVFTRNGTSWAQQAMLVSSNGVAFDEFGTSVSIDGDTAAVSAPGSAAYVFVRNGMVWTEQAILIGSDAIPSVDYYAYQVAISGDTVAVSSPEDDHSGLGGAGSAYVFVRSGTTWQEQAILRASDAAASDEFGESIACWGDTVIVGTDDDSHGGVATAGSAYVFGRTGTTWTEQRKLVASTPDKDDGFGVSVALWGSTATVGAPAHQAPPGGTDPGSAYVYELLPTTYCTAGYSATGCQALVSATGTASASAASGFDLMASNAEGNKNGILFFGTNGRQANPWGNGSSIQCVVPPVKRAGLLSGTGTNGNCDGAFSQDLNAHWTAQPAHNPGAGAVVQAQLWYRDPLNTSNRTTSLSDAIEFCVSP